MLCFYYGANSRRKNNCLWMTKTFVLKAAHPSPFSVERGFFGCQHFSKANAYLAQNGIAPINWKFSVIPGRKNIRMVLFKKIIRAYENSLKKYSEGSGQPGHYSFRITMLVFLIPFFIVLLFKADPKKTNIFIRFARIWMEVFLTSIGCPLTVRGRKNFATGETYIVVCNHNSFMDVPVSSPCIPGGNKTIAKIEMSKVPVFGLLYKIGSVLVDRKNEASRRESFGKMKEVLNMGLHMCIYPEGTRNKTHQPLKSFHEGAFKLAKTQKSRLCPH